MEAVFVLTLSEAEHFPVPSVVQLNDLPPVHTPLTTAPDRAGLTKATTVAFQKFLLTVALLPVKEAMVMFWPAGLFTVTVIDALPIEPPVSVTAAVIVCVPEPSTALKDAPVPI